MLEHHVKTEAGLSDLCDTLRGSAWLALDTEFVREKTYYPQFCLLQISNGEVAATVDPLQIERLDPLLEILFDEGIVKVFHAGRQDLEIFYNLWGRLPTPLFDTQLAASLLGLGDQVGYGNLVEKLLDHRLEKGHSRTDWSRRPLDEAQLRYALDDVIYLGDIYLELEQRLRAEGRETWLQDDFEQLGNPETYLNPPQEAWKRVKGRQQLKGVQLAILRELAGWREQEAQQANRPKRWILKDEVLTDLARRQPKSSDQLGKIRGLEAGTIKRHGERLLAMIARARELPKSEWPLDKRRPPRLDNNQEALADLLYCSLRLLAEGHNITPAAIAGRREIESLVAGERDLELLQGWRRKVVGSSLLQVLDGALWPQMVSGRLQLVERQAGD
ncbi:MAG: ribonuclease D [Sedimenticola sp.]|nr:ribonuclease D [Sedimenticola sp.]